MKEIKDLTMEDISEMSNRDLLTKLIKASNLKLDNWDIASDYEYTDKDMYGNYARLADQYEKIENMIKDEILNRMN